MELRLFVLAVLCGELTNVLCNDNCATYGSVQRQNDICSGAYLSRTYRPGVNSSALFLSLLRHDCSAADQYYSCMNSYIKGCKEEAVVSAEMRRRMNYCNGSDVKDWIKDLAFTYDNRDRGCLWRTVEENNGICNDAHEQFMELHPFEEIATTVKEGLISLKSLKSGSMQCMKETVHTTGSVCQAWQEDYIALSLAGYGTTASRPFGVYLEDSDIEMLQELAAEVQSANGAMN